MFTHPKCTLCVLCRLMQLHSEVAFLGARYQLPNCLSIRTHGPGRPHVGHCPVFLVLFHFATRSPSSVGRSPWNFATWTIYVPKFGRPSPKKVRGQKRAKLGSVSNHFKLRSRISPERMEISKIGKRCDRQRGPGLMCVHHIRHHISIIYSFNKSWHLSNITRSLLYCRSIERQPGLPSGAVSGTVSTGTIPGTGRARLWNLRLLRSLPGMPTVQPGLA